MLSGCVDVNIMEYVMYSLWKLETDPSKQEHRTVWCIYSVSSLIWFWTVSIQLCLVNSTGSMFSSKPGLFVEIHELNPNTTQGFRRSLQHSDLGSAWNELAVYPLCAVCWQWNRFRRRVGLRSLAQSGGGGVNALLRLYSVKLKSLGDGMKEAWTMYQELTYYLYFAIPRLIDDICAFHFAWEIRRECGFFKLWGCGPGHRCLRKWRDLHDIDFEKFIGASLATEKETGKVEDI